MTIRTKRGHRGGLALCVLVAAATAAGGCGGWGMDRELYELANQSRRLEPGRKPPSLAAGGTVNTIATRPAAFTPAAGSSASAAGSMSGGASGLPSPAGEADYVRLALARNPRLRSAEHKVERLAERIVQQGSLDDPMLTVAPIGEMAETAAGQVGVMTSISQKFPLPAKLNARARMAARMTTMAAAELERARLDTEADARSAYWNYYYAVAAIRVTEASRDVLRQLRDAAEARLRAGAANQQDVLRANVELSSLENELLNWRQRRDTAAARLNSLIDRPVTDPLPPPAQVAPERAAVELDGMLDQAVRNNPDLARSRQQIEFYRQQLRLARLNRWPDLTLSLNYNFVQDEGLARMTRNGRDQWWVGFGLNLPIWAEKLSAGEREARAGVQEATSDYHDVRNNVMYRVRNAAGRVDNQQRSVALLADVIIPQARQTLEASRAAYVANALDFQILTDNWRHLLAFELMYRGALAELGRSLADLRRQVGAALPATPTATPATQPEETGDRP